MDSSNNQTNMSMPSMSSMKNVLSNPGSYFFKPLAFCILLGIIAVYWLFFGSIYQNEYFKNASMFWVLIIAVLFLLYS